MHLLRVLLPGLAFSTCLAAAQQQNLTDAQLNGFAGPVRSVSTIVTKSEIEWKQPGGPALVMPPLCPDCEYDPDGTRTASGVMVEGKLMGEKIRLVRDAEGHVIERFATDAATGELQSHEVM